MIERYYSWIRNKIKVFDSEFKNNSVFPRTCGNPLDSPL